MILIKIEKETENFMLSLVTNSLVDEVSMNMSDVNI